MNKLYQLIGLNPIENKVTIQENYFAISQIMSSLILTNIYYDEFGNIINEIGSSYGDRVVKVLIFYYSLDIFVLLIFKFKIFFKTFMVFHHIVSILIFLYIWKNFKWDQLTVLCGTLWKLGDIPQAFYIGWVIPSEYIKNYKYIFGTIKVSLRLSAYITPILISKIKKIESTQELYNAIFIVSLLQLILDFTTTRKYITNILTWIWLVLITSLILFYY